MPNLMFLASTICEILGGPKIPKLGDVTPTWPLLNQFCIFFLRAHRRTSPCQIWSFYFQPFARYYGVPKFQNWDTWPKHGRFWPNFAFSCQSSLPSVSVSNLKFLALTVTDILLGSQNSKIVSLDTYVTPFDPILHFFR